jgi:hypothetical protein
MLPIASNTYSEELPPGPPLPPLPPPDPPSSRSRVGSLMWREYAPAEQFLILGLSIEIFRVLVR